MSETIAPTPILQFGTSRFLQAHADLFFTESDPQRAVTVVQSSGDAARAKRLSALAAADGYPVVIRGLQNGQVMEEERRVTAVKRCLSTASDWDEITRVVCEEAELVISNTGDAGFQPQPADLEATPCQEMSYPAKLFHLLAARFAYGACPLMVMPLELVPENGQVLRERLLEIGASNGASDALLAWIGNLPFANSLVDRIVSQPIEPAGAVAEPYALWAIEMAKGITAPCEHPCVQMVEDIEEIERLKLHILNLGHTALVDFWRTSGVKSGVFVRDLMAGVEGEALLSLYAEEVIPGFAHKGRGAEAEAYLATTLERLRNPTLEHAIADIAQNHPQKVERRIAAFRSWLGAEAPATPRLHAIVERAFS